MSDTKEFLVWPNYSQRSLARLFQAQSATDAVRSMFYREHDNLNTLSFDDDGYSQTYFVVELGSEEVQMVQAEFVVEVQTTILPKE